MPAIIRSQYTQSTMKIASPEYQCQLERREQSDGVGRQPVEERVGEHRQQGDDEQRPGPERQCPLASRLQPVDQPQDADDAAARIGQAKMPWTGRGGS